jgi:DNA (cytosine-5)-methyltransferase 1
MRYLSVCSGIEAASVAWCDLGWEAAGFSEIERFPSEVLRHRFPNVRNYGDMTNFKEWEDVGTFDLLVGGTPCQSFSVAGLRKGLDDPRGNLMLSFGAMASHFRPKWVVWENVPGVLSSNGGRDFGTFLGMLAELGYGFAYRVLDAQYFGVAQRRRRVFVVGHLGDWRCAAAVLFESESLSGNPPPSREKGAGIAFNAQGSASQGLSAGRTSPTLDKSKVHAVCYGIPGNWIGRKPENGGNATTPMVDLSPCLTGADRHAVCIPLDMREVERGDGKAMGVETGDEADPAYTLTAGKVHAVCYENHAQDGRVKECSEVSPTLSARAGTGGGNLPIVMAHGQANAEITEGVCPTLNCSHESPIIADSCQLRRFTPMEYERLQGFPDNWTRIPYRGKPAEKCPDSPRYKACGNSMAVPVMRWIGERIQMMEDIMTERDLFGEVQK